MSARSYPMCRFQDAWTASPAGRASLHDLVPAAKRREGRATEPAGSSYGNRRDKMRRASYIDIRINLTCVVNGRPTVHRAS
jgi:hypothetical protein